MTRAQTLHVVEPGGQGGVYQSIIGAAQNGQYSLYKNIVIHTARDAEITPALPHVRYCRCMRYQRSGNQHIRRIASLAWVALILIPHLTWHATRPANWEIQGLFGTAIYALFVAVPGTLGRDVTFVPHNSFARDGSRLDAAAKIFSSKRATQTAVFTKSETVKWPAARKIEVRTLYMYIPPRDQTTTEKWNQYLPKSKAPIIAFIGQLRKDKNPVLLLQAANLIERPLTLLFAGQDKGALSEIHAFNLNDRHDKVVQAAYLTDNDFRALVELSSVIICPYAIASQSGVAAYAAQLNKPVVASNVGGLAEQADYIFELTGSNDAEHLAEAIRGSIN